MSKQHWNNNNRSRFRHLVTFAGSVALLGLFMLIPVNLYFESHQQEKTIQLELSKLKPETKKPQKKQPNKPLPISPKKPIVVQPKTTPVLSSKKIAPLTNVVITEKVVSIKPKSTPKAQPNKPLPSSGIILNSTSLISAYKDLDKDFVLPTGNEEDFKFKVYEQPSWNQVTKLIDEEIDKPEYVMNFYSEGVVGATERFFDKISYKKTFTTRYGTKITCGGVGPLAICSWK